MAQPTASHLANLSRVIRRLERKQAQVEEVRTALDHVRRAGIVVRGESWMLGQVEKLQADAGRLLDALEASETTREAAAHLAELEELLERPEWDLAGQVLTELQGKESQLADTQRDLEDQIDAWNVKLGRWEELLERAKRFRAPVIQEERLVKRLRDTLTSAAQALRGQELGQVAVRLEQLRGVDQEPSGGEQAEDLEPEKLDELLPDKLAEASGFSRSVGLMFFQGPLLKDNYEYNVLLRPAGEPGSQHGVNIQGTSPLLKRDRDQMAELIDQVTAAVNAGLVRSFAEEKRASGEPVEAAVVEDADEEEGGEARFARPAAPPGQVTASVEIDELAKSVGDLMYRLVLPPLMHDYLERTNYSITITTNDLELPWELMWHQGEFSCLRHPMARMPMGRMFPRESRPPVRQDLKTHFLLICADPLGNLPAAEAEVDQIKEALESSYFRDRVQIDVWKGPKAEGRAFTDALRFGEYDVIHYAGHALFDAEDPERSGLLLHGREVFTAQRIHRLLEGRPLVYLNACESGRVANEDKAQIVGEYSQERAEGLASALLYGGALGCIGALWPVFDEPAAEFAIEFYKRVLEGYMLGEAMRRARLEIKDRHPTQITWAAFVLYGDPTYRLVE